MGYFKRKKARVPHRTTPDRENASFIQNQAVATAQNKTKMTSEPDDKKELSTAPKSNSEDGTEQTTMSSAPESEEGTEKTTMSSTPESEKGKEKGKLSTSKGEEESDTTTLSHEEEKPSAPLENNKTKLQDPVNEIDSPLLTASEIMAAQEYNDRKFNSEAEIRLLRSALGLSTDTLVIDEEVITAAAQWQSDHGLTIDGKVGPRTAASLGYQMQQEAGTDPDKLAAATTMLERGIVISFSGNSYMDTATESHKRITFQVDVPQGLNREDYALVNWVKGYAKTGTGNFFVAELYGSDVDVNFANYQVDSLDTDPIYWSDADAGVRWNYRKEGSRRFTATDDPGGARSTQLGADFNLNFKLQVYRVADLPEATTGNLGGAESKAIATVFWEYKTKVSATGEFSH